MPTTEHRLGPVDQIPVGEGRNFSVAAQQVAVFRTRQGGLFATQANCPHRGGPLADGLIGENTVICPLHDWNFDLATGETKNGECGITVYPVRAVDGEIVLTVETL